MKDLILDRLKTEKCCYVSGELLSGEIGVSRTAVWKNIKELRNDGYVIESSPKKGYKLISTPDILSEYEIGHDMNTVFMGKHLKYLDVIDSTNNYAKKIAEEGAFNGTLVVSNRQTQGKGRLGRQWASADQKGIWMSLILRPKLSPEEAQIITLGSSVAVVRAIYETTGIKTGIKWPNDIILDGKKVCGILTEMNSELDQINYLVTGIGINVNQDIMDFPEDIRYLAISLRQYYETGNEEVKNLLPGGTFKRSKILKRILFEFEQIYSKIESGFAEEIIAAWKENSITLGKQVNYTLKNVKYSGYARDITADGKLVVECLDGGTREISSGEVSVRGVLGYT